MKQTKNHCLRFSRLFAAFIPVLLTTTAQACELQITWKAALAAPKSLSDLSLPAALPLASGTAAIDFDFVHPSATVQVDTKNLHDVTAIELHVARSYTNHIGPAVLTLYSSAAGPLPVTLTKRVTEADLHKQAMPKVAVFSDLVNAVLNGRAYVTVSTTAHPEGELSGFIGMHKEQIYSDNASDSSHDPALHHAAVSPPTSPIISPKL